MIKGFVLCAVVLLKVKQNIKLKGVIVANGKCKNCDKSKKNKPKIAELKKALIDGLTFPEAMIYSDFEGYRYRQVLNMLITSLTDKEKDLIINIKW